MLAFIDESGDVGVNLEQGSTWYLTVAAVLFLDERQAAICDHRLKGLKKELGLHEEFEFHFSRCPDGARERFLKCVSVYEFVYSAGMIDKRKLRGKEWRKKETLATRAAGIAIESLLDDLAEAKVYFDKSASRDYNQRFAKSLKKHAGKVGDKFRIAEIVPLDSRKHNLIQLADMVCGAVTRSQRGEGPDAHDFREIIKERERAVVIWP